MVRRDRYVGLVLLVSIAGLGLLRVISRPAIHHENIEARSSPAAILSTQSTRGGKEVLAARAADPMDPLRNVDLFVSVPSVDLTRERLADLNTLSAYELSCSPKCRNLEPLVISGEQLLLTAFAEIKARMSAPGWLRSASGMQCACIAAAARYADRAMLDAFYKAIAADTQSVVDAQNLELSVEQIGADTYAVRLGDPSHSVHRRFLFTAQEYDSHQEQVLDRCRTQMAESIRLERSKAFLLSSLPDTEAVALRDGPFEERDLIEILRLHYSRTLMVPDFRTLDESVLRTARDALSRYDVNVKAVALGPK